MRIPSRIRAVFFDAVGTLIHPTPGAPEVYALIGRRFGSRLPLDVLAGRFREAMRIEKAYDQWHGLRTSESREVERWRSIVGRVLDDVDEPEACFQELFAHFSRPAAWRCSEQVAQVLTELATRGHVLGIASNYDQRLRSVVAGLPVLSPIQHLVISSEVGWRKPAAEFYLAMVRTVSMAPEQILHVGDDREDDYAGGRLAGLATVHLDPRGQCAPSPDTRVEELAELLAWLGEHAGQSGERLAAEVSMRLFDWLKKQWWIGHPGEAARRAVERVECPACGGFMVDTGQREISEITHTEMRIMACPSCGNEAGVSISRG